MCRVDYSQEAAKHLNPQCSFQIAPQNAITLDDPQKNSPMLPAHVSDDQSIQQLRLLKNSSSNSLIKKHEQETGELEKEQLKEMTDLENAQEAVISELIAKQSLEIQKLLDQQKTEITELKSVHQKEIFIEEAMHDTEMKALLERKILNSILETVDDGIINISPFGTLLRFNQGAEKIWGYQASEVLGKNIKILMPAEYALEHDDYLKNYLTTGIKKVIGLPNGRRVKGLKKDGTIFPLQLSVSELKTDGTHMFTGIARDLTQEVLTSNDRLNWKN